MASATVSNIHDWLKHGSTIGATHIFVVCDTYDYEYYPVYIKETDDSPKLGYQEVKNVPNAKDYSNNAIFDVSKTMQCLTEVYKISDPWTSQLNENRCFRF